MFFHITITNYYMRDRRANANDAANQRCPYLSVGGMLLNCSWKFSQCVQEDVAQLGVDAILGNPRCYLPPGCGWTTAWCSLHRPQVRAQPQNLWPADAYIQVIGKRGVEIRTCFFFNYYDLILNWWDWNVMHDFKVLFSLYS